MTGFSASTTCINLLLKVNSMNDVCTEQRFLTDAAQHEMTIIRDDGVHRHIQFKRPGTRCYQFDLITWPGYLCYTGDMGTYVFTRLRDMFEFFRTDRNYMRLKDGKTLAINPGYWGEKLEAIDKCDGFKEFSEEKFKRAVMEYLVRWIRENYSDTDKDERRELWDEVMSQVIDADDDNGGHRKQAAVHDFTHHVNQALDFEFVDFWEHDLTDYSFRFMWCCYALAWGVQKYDEKKAEDET